MGNVLLANASAADAWVGKDIGSDQPDVWVTFPLYFSPAAAAFWIANLSGSFVALYIDPDHGGDGVYVNSGEYQTFWSTGGGPPVGGAWILAEHHHVDGGASELYLAGSLVASATDLSGYDTRIVRVGQEFATPDASALVYFRYVKIGSSRGAADLFSDDFSSGNLSAWDATEGAVSVVTDPLPDPGLVISTAPGLAPTAFTERART